MGLMLMDMPEIRPLLPTHRPLQALFSACFDAGLVVNGIEEPALPPPEHQKPGVRWSDMTEVPPILVVRTAQS